MANIVQNISNTATDTTTDTLAFANNISQNDVLVAIVATMGTANHVRSITDSLGQTWNKITYFNAYNDIEIWYTVATASQPETVTVNMENTGDINLTLIEISGLNINNLIAGQYTEGGESSNPEISISPALNNVFVLSAVNSVVPSSASPSTNEVPSVSPISPAVLLTTNSIDTDNETVGIDYVADASSLSNVGFQNVTPTTFEFDLVVAIFNLTTTTISTSPCSSLPFPLNDICYSINTISSDIVNTGQGLLSGLGYFAQAFYQAITSFATNIYNGIISIATNFYNAITNFASSVETAFYNFGQWIYNGLNYIYVGLNNFGNWLYAGLEDFVKTLIAFFNWVWQGIINIFNVIYSAFTTGVDTLFTSLESGIVSMQNTLVSKLSQEVAVAIIMPSEFELSKHLINNFGTFNTKGILGTLGGMLAIPLVAAFIGDILQGIISPSAISKIFPRPSLPSIAIPTQTLTISPTSSPTNVTPTSTPPIVPASSPIISSSTFLPSAQATITSIIVGQTAPPNREQINIKTTVTGQIVSPSATASINSSVSGSV